MSKLTERPRLVLNIQRMRIKIFILTMTLFSQMASAGLTDVGFNIHSERIDDPDYYSADTKNGAKLKDIYIKHAGLRKQKFSKLPEDFNPIIARVAQYIPTHSVLDNKNNQYYVGRNGELNGEEFNFSIDKLPTKIVRLAFCFGIDPSILTAIIHKESKFKREVESKTGAFGFMQLTSVAITEVSEQLGILGDAYYGTGASEVLNQYIDCYMGTEKEWVNIWEDGTVPKGAAAYANNKIGPGRDWKYITESKDWLNADPDRNLVYGAVLFKLYLGIEGNYPEALKKYNVSHPQSYAPSVKKYYNQMQATPNNQVAATATAKKINYSGQIVNMGEWTCFVESAELDSSLELVKMLKDLYSEADLRSLLESDWKKKGFCKKRLTRV